MGPLFPNRKRRELKVCDYFGLFAQPARKEISVKCVYERLMQSGPCSLGSSLSGFTVLSSCARDCTLTMPFFAKVYKHFIGYGEFKAEGITSQIHFPAVLCSSSLKAMPCSSLPPPLILYYPPLLIFFPHRHLIREYTLSLFRPSLKGKRSNTGVLWKKHFVSI